MSWSLRPCTARRWSSGTWSRWGFREVKNRNARPGWRRKKAQRKTHENTKMIRNWCNLKAWAFFIFFWNDFLKQSFWLVKITGSSRLLKTHIWPPWTFCRFITTRRTKARVRISRWLVISTGKYPTQFPQHQGPECDYGFKLIIIGDAGAGQKNLRHDLPKYQHPRHLRLFGQAKVASCISSWRGSSESSRPTRREFSRKKSQTVRL